MNSFARAHPRLTDVLPFPADRVVILAEYPYYRANPDAWVKNLTALRELGADVITAYVPWRLHEIAAPGGGFEYDFDGRSHPHRDLLGFLERAAAAGLKVLLKPGPYVHGEIRLGGLPDRAGEFASRLAADGTVLTEELVAMPSAHSQEFRHAANQWLRAFREQVVTPTAAPHGPVVALQVGNEGVFGEVHAPMDAEDYSPAALEPLGITSAGVADHHARLASWSGTRLRQIIAEYRDTLDSPVPIVWNLPLPGPDRQLEAWLTRTAATLPAGILPTNTSWSGNAATSDHALTSLWLGMRAHHTDTLEDNWGFTWSDDSYARPSTPLYNALLGLAFGSSTISVYTACTTYNWAPGIGPDDAALRAEGQNPLHYAPPYCPGAPLHEDGQSQPNATALRVLRKFLDWDNGLLLAARPRADAWLVTDATTVAETTWPASTAEAMATPTQVAVAAGSRWMLAEGVDIDPVDRAPAGEGPLIIVGGKSMSEATQRSLAAQVRSGRSCVLIGPVPRANETAAACTLLAEAFDASAGSARVVPVTGDSETSIQQALAFLGVAKPAATFGPLVLRRHCPAGEVTWLFNRSDQPVEVGLESGVALRLAPRGAAGLISESGVLRTFLVHVGTDAAREPAQLSIGGGEPPWRFDQHTVGRRTENGWQLWSDAIA